MARTAHPTSEVSPVKLPSPGRREGDGRGAGGEDSGWGNPLNRLPAGHFLDSIHIAENVLNLSPQGEEAILLSAGLIFSLARVILKLRSLSALHRDIAALLRSLSALLRNVAELRRSVAALLRDLAELPRNLAELHRDVAELR